jgi:hypothetical protein
VEGATLVVCGIEALEWRERGVAGGEAREDGCFASFAS